MARKALIIKDRRKRDRVAKAKKKGNKAKFPTRTTNRCKLCGRNRGFMRRFELCRICFRELASEGKIMGVKKSSW